MVHDGDNSHNAWHGSVPYKNILLVSMHGHQEACALNPVPCSVSFLGIAKGQHAWLNNDACCSS